MKMNRLFLLIFCVVFCVSCTPSEIELEKLNAKAVFSDGKVAELVIAAETGNIDRLNRLAKDGIDVNSKGRYNVTPLLRSLQAKNMRGFETLLKLGADPNTLDDNGFAVMTV